MSSCDGDGGGERPSKTAKLERDFTLCLACQKRKSKAQSKPKRESLIKLMTIFKSTNNMEIPNTQQFTIGSEI